MKKTIYPLLVLVGLLNACQYNNPTDDPENVKRVLLDYFDGIKNKDFQKMKDVTTSDFILYEDGKVFNNDSLINMLNTFPKFKAVYTFDNFQINVDNSSARMNYFNHGEFTINDTTQMTFNWLESATFRKEGDKWKMEFLHSTVRK